MKKCIKSVLRQSYTRYICILVDDGSNDKSGSICDRFAKNDARVVVIHKENQGSAEARKTGCLSEYAQKAEFICFMDADDTMNENALECMHEMAEENELDCVCGRIGRIWRNFKFPTRFSAPCFGETRVYTHNEIISDLYISCFGISDYPVSLCAKLYRTQLISNAIQFEPVVKFMGDDLSVTLRVLPEARRLGILTDTIYNYRFGGGTSKFMPYMLEDFLSLYNFKSEMRKKYKMPQDAEYYMAVELLNETMSWFHMLQTEKRINREELLFEIERVAGLREVQESLTIIADRKTPNELSELYKNKKYEDIERMVNEQILDNRFRSRIRKLLIALE